MTEQKNKTYLVSGFDESFLPRAIPYLETMNKNSNLFNMIVTLDFDINLDLRSKFNNIEFVKASSVRMKCLNPVNNCMQHGAFIDALPGLNEKSVIMFTDKDIDIQRNFNADELDFICGFEDGQIGVGYNRSSRDFLSEEAERLKPTVDIETINQRYPGVYDFVTFNVGVIIANKKTYKELYEKYNSYWPEFRDTFLHGAKQQWLLSYLINRYFHPVIIPDIIHTHGKYPVELRVNQSFGYKFHVGPELVVLNHAIKHPAEIQLNKMRKRMRSKNRLIKKMLAALLALVLLCVFLIFKLYSKG